MISFILDYLANKEVCASSQSEQDRLEAGIARFLLENGIGESDTGEYYIGYVKSCLKTIAQEDLKQYFINYLLISNVHQIIIEYKYDGFLTEERKRELYQLMEELYSCGLGEKYIPKFEVKQILDFHQ